MIGLLSVKDPNTGEFKTLAQIADIMVDKAAVQCFHAAMSEFKWSGTITLRRRASRGWRKHVRRMKAHGRT